MKNVLMNAGVSSHMTLKGGSGSGRVTGRGFENIYASPRCLEWCKRGGPGSDVGGVSRGCKMLCGPISN